MHNVHRVIHSLLGDWGNLSGKANVKDSGIRLWLHDALMRQIFSKENSSGFGLDSLLRFARVVWPPARLSFDKLMTWLRRSNPDGSQAVGFLRVHIKKKRP